ncbi:class I SAM-dependent methyltransferase [Alteriqipengyuania lutimaris]|uniref:Class I SAM-dependent methyltransferase n=1 Tax=Alteriqipengyuania lutimaris TaxID=1538146 RepID=A0A395LHX5_9SPHN|nr:class I SAM-dependent methyltransferase [Alteriqipengyuania lutimaris]MBB3035250.1 cyclopropane fatty-acyl-phospholipid synthase-like methyltransferase [Alteriqipengyuania lutimaris]RDS75847.1 class I SAM-dependent methyltransferase [Alteriqipengyuania lutimaris]
MSTDRATIAYYEQAAPHYTASTAQDWHRHLDPFLDRLEPGAWLLELGCGCGADAAHMAKRGFRVDATDGTRAMTRKANERFGIDARVMLFEELDASARYDAVWAHASLLHAPRADLPGIFGRIHTALKPGGWHFANFKLGDADHPDEGRDPLGRWTNLPDEAGLEAAYVQAGFAVVETERYRGNGSDGVQRDWLALTLRTRSGIHL